MHRCEEDAPESAPSKEARGVNRQENVSYGDTSTLEQVPRGGLENARPPDWAIWGRGTPPLQATEREQRLERLPQPASSGLGGQKRLRLSHKKATTSNRKLLPFLSFGASISFFV